MGDFMNINNKMLTTMRFLLTAVMMTVPFLSMGQGQDSLQVDDLKRQILELRTDVDNIQLNLTASHQRFKRGIFMATLGYTVTIAGGLMLGRKNDDLGKVMLISGGAIGCIGTGLLIDSFKYLGRAGKRSRDR